MGHRPAPEVPTTAAVRGRITDRRASTALGLASFLGAGGAWLLLAASVAFAPWWAKPLLGVLTGVAIAVLFVVGHDAAHGSLFPRRRLNRLAGRLGLLPALHPYSSWLHSHNRQHHSFTNLKGKDSSFPPLSPDEYRALPGWRRWLERRYRTWYGLGLYYFVEVWLRWEVLPSPDHAPKNPRAFRRDRLVVLAFAAAWVGLLAAAAVWRGDSAVGLVLVGFVLPQMVWNWLIGFIIFQQHTHPRIPWYSDRDAPDPAYFHMQVQATPHIHFPGPVRWLMRHIMEHTAHHADPLVPLYRLPEAQRELNQAYRRHIVRPVFTKPQFLHTLRVCKLYDFEAHRWVGYDGQPTTGPLRPTPGTAVPPSAAP